MVPGLYAYIHLHSRLSFLEYIHHHIPSSLAFWTCMSGMHEDADVLVAAQPTMLLRRNGHASTRGRSRHQRLCMLDLPTAGNLVLSNPSNVGAAKMSRSTLGGRPLTPHQRIRHDALLHRVQISTLELVVSLFVDVRDQRRGDPTTHRQCAQAGFGDVVECVQRAGLSYFSWSRRTGQTVALACAQANAAQEVGRIISLPPAIRLPRVKALVAHDWCTF